MSGRIHRVEMYFLLSFSPLCFGGLYVCFKFLLVVKMSGRIHRGVLILVNSRSPPMNRNPRFCIFEVSFCGGHFYRILCWPNFMSTFASHQIHSGGVSNLTPYIYVYIV